MTYTGDDKKLLEGLISGREWAYEKLFMTYYVRLVVFAKKIIGDEDMSRDLVQDTFVMFYEKRVVLNIHTSLKSHLYQTVRNRCLNHIKKNKIQSEHHSGIFLDKKNEEAYFNDIMLETELEARIHSIVDSLPKQCKRIFEMSRYEGITNQEIAEKLNLSKRTVETQISKALKILRNHLKDYVNLVIFIILMLIK